MTLYCMCCKIIFEFEFENFVFVIPVPRFYSYTEGAAWKILDLLKDPPQSSFNPRSRFPGHSAESNEEGCIGEYP